MRNRNFIGLMIIIGCAVVYGMLSVNTSHDVGVSTPYVAPQSLNINEFTMLKGKSYGRSLSSPSRLKEVNWDSGDSYTYSGEFATGGVYNYILTFKSQYYQGLATIGYSLRGSFIFLFDIKYDIVRLHPDYVILRKSG